MIHSLRFRLLLLTVAVAGVALVAAALVSRVAVRREFQRLETSGRGLAGAAEQLGAQIESLERPAARDSALARLAASLGQELVLTGDDGRVIAASDPALHAARIERRADGAVTVTQARRGPALETRRALILGLTPAAVRGRDGRRVGWLVPFAGWSGGAHGAHEFLPAVNRWLLVAVVGAGALAVILTLALSRRILGPVEALTRAVRRMEAGDLGHRVGFRSGDEIGELARAFDSMADALERNEALRRQLVTDVAHELRTPLTNLRCQIEALQDGLLPASEATVRSLHEETLLLGRLVDDLQDLALAESGRLPLHREAVAIGPAIEAALAAVQSRVAERRIRLDVALAPGLPDADADPARLAQILRNLLANALTHTPEGGAITVSAEARGGAVALAVRDTGPGITPEHLPRVFDRFYRADPSRTRASGGTGLGLAIVRQLVEAHGGTVRVESEPGRGACFTFELPAAPSS